MKYFSIFNFKIYFKSFAVLSSILQAGIEISEKYILVLSFLILDIEMPIIPFPQPKSKIFLFGFIILVEASINRSEVPVGINTFLFTRLLSLLIYISFSQSVLHYFILFKILK